METNVGPLDFLFDLIDKKLELSNENFKIKIKNKPKNNSEEDNIVKNSKK